MLKWILNALMVITLVALYTMHQIENRTDYLMGLTTGTALVYFAIAFLTDKD
jgi:hypothetical protein